MEKLGKVIQEIRRSKYISQRKLANMLDVEFSLISQIENNRVAYERRMVTRIAYALDVPPIVLETIYDLLNTPLLDMKTLKKVEIVPIFVETIPPIEDMKEGEVYISEQYQISIHLCLCGCKNQTVLPLNKNGWHLIKEKGNKVSFTPSVGNFNFDCKSHYIITKSVANFV